MILYSRLRKSLTYDVLMFIRQHQGSEGQKDKVPNQTHILDKYSNCSWIWPPQCANPNPLSFGLDPVILSGRHLNSILPKNACFLDFNRHFHKSNWAYKNFRFFACTIGYPWNSLSGRFRPQNLLFRATSVPSNVMHRKNQRYILFEVKGRLPIFKWKKYNTSLPKKETSC